jgi:Cupin
MDILSDLLRVVRLSGVVFFIAEFSSPWALDSPNPELPGPSYCLMRSTVSHVYGVSNLGSINTLRHDHLTANPP